MPGAPAVRPCFGGTGARSAAIPSGSGSKTINVPEGKIKVTLSAYPIKNYASNYLYVTGSNGESGGVDWGSKSAVETRSDSFTYTSDSPETFTIEYYETVSWEVEFYAYQ